MEFDSALSTQLIDAINRRVEIEFLYEDDPYFIFRPHVLFVSPEELVFLECFRPGGGFRDYDVRGIRDLVITDRTFEPDFSIANSARRWRTSAAVSLAA